MDKNPSEYKGNRIPVDTVSWWDTLEYCNKLSKKYNLEPVYDLSQREEGVLRINQLGGNSEYPNMADFRKTEGFRLPTALEWEWFARGGEIAIQDGTFDYKYSGSENIGEVAWYEGNSGNKPHDVGTKKPNQLGIYDCTGNLREWCYDTASWCYDSSNLDYISEKLAYVYDASMRDRKLRGAAWNCHQDLCTINDTDRISKNILFTSFTVIPICLFINSWNSATYST